MKVAYLLDSFPNVSETFILDEVVCAREAGVACFVFSLARPSPQPVHADAQALLDAGLVEYHREPARPCKARALAGQACRRPVRTGRLLAQARHQSGLRWEQTNALPLVRRFDVRRIDHVHVHYAGPAAQYALAVHRWSGRPFTVTTHHNDIFHSPPENFPELGDASSGIVCISEYNRRYIADRFGVALEKLPLIHCGIRPERFAFEPVRPGQAGAPVRLLCVARLAPVKGHRYLLEALARLREAGLNCKLTLAGDGPEREALERQAAQFGLADAVRFLGFQRQTEIRALYRWCDLMVLPSLSEGIPISLMEAMACGKPVVATAVRGVPELVEEKVTGLLCPPEDPEALARAVTWILDHPDEVTAIARRARERVVQDFDRQTSTRHLIDLWRASARQAPGCRED